MNTFYNKKNNDGYIALISAIIISFILISLTFTVSASGYFSRANVSNIEYKRVSLGLAESCANAALLKISIDYNYNLPIGGVIVPVGTEVCLIQKITNTTEMTGRSTSTIYSQGAYRSAYSNIKVVASVANPSRGITLGVAPVLPVIDIVAWEESTTTP